MTMTKDILTLEKLRIDERLQSVEKQLEVLIKIKESEHENFLKSMERLMTLVEKHEKMIFGNGTPGMNVRVDRIEKSEERRGWTMRLIWSSIAALTAKILYDVVKVSPR